MMEMNPMQQQAVEHVDGPLLILAGAGSGKTRVITRRAAYLIREQGVDPYNIMAITFTNKAAGEMRERISQEVGHGAEAIWCTTFHSGCVRILRRYIDRIGYDQNFSIYDTDDSKSLMKQVIKAMDLDPKQYKERSLLNVISAAKNELISPIEFKLKNQGDYGMQVYAEAYSKYQKALRDNNALDFDDLIFKTVELFQDHADVLRNYQERFRYIMVDEYQDTNTAQFVLIRLLAGKYRNLCVVGDDDQSIYKFRGANIHNILDFEDTYPEAKVIRLEQNYRSTQNILDAANGVISNNKNRKGKTLWTDNEKGKPIEFQQFDNAYEEADFVARQVASSVRAGGSYMDHAVLYRTNAQSRIMEEKFIMQGIPYKIVGGVNFYARKEIKDLLAYLKTIDNHSDDLGVRRIINVPKRGIGDTTIGRIQQFADMNGIDLYEAMGRVKEIEAIKRGGEKILEFYRYMEDMRQLSGEILVSDLLERIIADTGYIEELKAEGTEEAQARIENIEELMNKVLAYEETAEEVTLGGFLQEVALVADIDNLDQDSDYTVLMTLHSAKGLEFPHVYLVGMEDGLFPSYMAIAGDDPTELEEERRLCYVGITRAEKTLHMTAAKVRMVRGQYQYSAVSRFVEEVPKELISGYIPKHHKEWESDDDAGSMRGASPSQIATQRSVNKAKKAKPYATMDSLKKGADMGISDQSSLGYQVGDRVKHIKFGEGQVLEIKSGGRDFEVAVDFDRVGVKKMFASFAKLKKV